MSRTNTRFTNSTLATLLKSVLLAPVLLASVFTGATSISLTANAANIDLESVKQDIEMLASDELKGRRVFTEEIDQAANYIAERFKSSGLAPFNGSYLQGFNIATITNTQLEVTINNLTINQELVTIASSNTSINWQHSGDVAGSTVKVTIIGEHDNLRKALADINMQGGEHLALVHPKHQALFKRYKAYFDQGLTKLNTQDAGTLILALSEIDKIEQFSVIAQSKITEKQLTNVVGVLPGKTRSQEIVLFSAHYDHLGTKLTAEHSDQENTGHQASDTIYNGADDNASGVTGILNLAQYYAKQANNERSLLFVAFTAEEIGGFGSKYFSQQLAASDVIAMINLEMIGKESKFGQGKLWMTGMERSDLGTIMNSALAEKSLVIEADPYPEQQLFYRSDNATLARLGVPAHSFSSVQLSQDKHYHAVSDQVDTIQLSSLKTVLETIAEAAKPIISGQATPSRIDTSQVSADGKIY
ncbi:M28 family peptidase [Colwellia sp. MEBiC06753]